MIEALKGIHWLHHASFRIELAGKVIYIDPWKIRNKIKADYIFVTHEHYDHLSPDDIRELYKESTVMFCPAGAMEEAAEFNPQKMLPNERKTSGILKIETIPAYNIGKSFHTKGSGKIGYIIEIDGKRIYHAGDTDVTPEMKALKNITIAMLPIGGTYTMTAKEAAEAVDIFKPDIAVPMHWGSISGSKKDAEEFKKLAKCRVEILEQEE
jgi:L-ascorbate metabolism protein UlaG (beta-lactamase superfamily)